MKLTLDNGKSNPVLSELQKIIYIYIYVNFLPPLNFTIESCLGKDTKPPPITKIH